MTFDVAARSQAGTVVEAELLIGKLEAIEHVSELANSAFSKSSSKLRHAVSDLRTVIERHGANYMTCPSEARDVVMRAVKFAQSLKAKIDTPILDNDGNLVLSTEKRVRDVAAMAV